MKLMTTLISTILALFAAGSFASEKKSENHSENLSTETHADHGHDRGEKESHEHDEDKASGNVGSDKGILEANEKRGFKLSPEAMKNFELKFMKLTGDGPWTLPKSVLVHSGEKVNLFRLRSGYFKRIDFQTLRKSGSELTVDSDDMREGDDIVLVGLGFLRIAELAAFGGVAHGHSH